MKNLLAIVLIVAMTTTVFGQDAVKQFKPEKAVVTGLVYGPGASRGAAILDGKIVYEGSTYWVQNGKIVTSVAGKRALKRIPKKDLLTVSAVSRKGVTFTYRGKTVTRPLKSRTPGRSLTQ
jgi:hypothetical protein